MEDDAIPFSRPESGRNTPEDFTIDNSNEQVVMASGRNIPPSTTHADTESSVMSSQTETSPPASAELPVTSTSSQEASVHAAPEEGSLPETTYAPTSTGRTRFSAYEREVLLSRPLSRDSLHSPSRSPPGHRPQMNHQRFMTPDLDRSIHPSPERLHYPLFSRPSPGIATVPTHLFNFELDRARTLESRPVNEYYESLQREHDILSNQLSEMRENLCCKVCMDREACVVFMPCAHMITCNGCGSQLSNCPICRSPVQYAHTAILD